jgi:hypothetical protein
VGESQFRRGDSHCGTLGIYVLCGPGSLITSRLLVPWYNASPSRDNASLWCAVISHALGPDSIRDNRALHMMKSGHVGETFF